MVVLERSGSTILGNSIAKDFKDKGHTTLIGKEAKDLKELAVLGQVYRNPSFETFRYFFVKDGKIVGQTGATSRLPDNKVVFPKKTNYESFGADALKEIEQQMKAVGTEGYYLLHKHSSGDPTPSEFDIIATKRLASNIRGFRSCHC